MYLFKLVDLLLIGMKCILMTGKRLRRSRAKTSVDPLTKTITSKSNKQFSVVSASLTLAFATIGRVSVVTRHAGLAVRTGGEVTALFAHAAVHTRAVAITLAC